MMPGWAKVVAGCLALMIGASAPPLILLLLIHHPQIAGKADTSAIPLPNRNIATAMQHNAMPKVRRPASHLNSPITKTPLLPKPNTRARGIRVRSGG